MTAPMFLDAPGLQGLSQRLSKVRVSGSVEQEMTVVRASVELDEASRRLTALAAVTAERDQARQMLTDAPHAIHCGMTRKPGYIGAGECFCWKAGL